MERTLYEEEGLALTEKDGELFLRIGEESCLLACHPYEPCTRLYRGESLRAAIHNAFTAEEIRALAKGGTARAVTGSEYDIGRLCRLRHRLCGGGRGPGRAEGPGGPKPGNGGEPVGGGGAEDQRRFFPLQKAEGAGHDNGGGQGICTN